MITAIKEERFEDFKNNAIWYGFCRMSNEWVNTQSKKRFIFVKDNREMYVFEKGKVITDVPYDYIPKLVWDGYIKKY
jgi:hypothetical protein